MYTIVTINKRVEKQICYYARIRPSIRDILDRLKEDPRRACDAHKLRGHLEGKWGCWLGSNIRMVYKIDDEKKEIIAFTVGPHPIYN